jgi:prolipoprotein diacylglyceryltransferase
VKENQEAYATILPLNTGQLLSLPFIAFGVYLIMRKKPSFETYA